MYFVLQGADFSQANLGQIEIELGSIGTGGTIDPNAKYTLTVNVNVEGATIKLTPEGGSTTTTNGTSGTIEVTYNTKVNIEVSKEDYNSYTRELTITRNRELSVELTPIASTTQYTLTITPDPTSATVTLTATGYSTVSGTGSKSITVANGTKVNWSVSADGYTTRTGNWTINGSNKTENIVLTTTGGEGAPTWYLDHTNQASSFTSSVNIAGRGWTHKPGTAGYNAYVGKPVNTIGFFTTLASQNITIGKVAEKGGESDMTVIATVTATNPTGTTKGFCSVTFPTVTLNSGECLVIFAQTDKEINFYYNSNASVTDANGIVDGNFYGRVPKVYGSGTAWTAYSEKICLGLSVGYNPDVA